MRPFLGRVAAPVWPALKPEAVEVARQPLAGWLVAVKVLKLVPAVQQVLVVPLLLAASKPPVFVGVVQAAAPVL